MKRIAVLVLLLAACSPAMAVVDTLRHWKTSNAVFVYYTRLGDGTSIALQAARFTPKAPGYIKSIILYFGGGTGSASLMLYGHEGGSHIPLLGPTGYTGATLASASFNKTVSGVQGAVWNLATPIWTGNNQFWIGVGALPTGVGLLMDSTAYEPTCTGAESGGDFYRQILFGSAGALAYGARAFAIDVVMEYPTLTSPQYFTDVTSTLGLPANLSNGTTAFADLDNDGWLDMLVSGKLYMNKQTGFTDATAQAGLSGTPRGNAFVDIDNDGDLDILFLHNGAACRLFVNDGSNVFTGRDLSIPQLAALSCFSLADLNNDKLPDLFVGQLWSKYDANGPDLQPNYLLLNSGGTDFTLQQGKATTDPPRRSRGSGFADFDNDGDLDLYVSNYFLEQDELWQNAGGNFTNVTDAKGVEKLVSSQPLYYNHGTGVDWADYDNDGDMDILSPQFCHPQNLRNNFEGTTIYRNEGAPDYGFTDLWKLTGIEYEETHASGCFGDVNNDGLTDLMMTVYYNCRYADFYLQKADHTFEMKTFEYGLDNLVSGEDAAFVDVDNDGDLDLAFADRGQFRLFRNNLPQTNGWVQLNLLSTSANAQGIGARVTVCAGGQRTMQEVTCGRGQRVEKPMRLHFGLGTASAIDSVLVRWPGRTGYEKFSVPINSITTLREGTGATDAAPAPDAGAIEDLAVQPLRGTTLFSFTLHQPVAVRLELYNLLGVRVAALDAGGAAGRQALSWDNADDRGARVPAGMYLYRLSSGSTELTGKFQAQ